ncbi:MAG TPA: PTS sugar transporter subunit IIB [Anaerolineae bacterium]|nr:PTS sugar transporter subunit IIB [Anaerolineae bacterium]HOQ98482.1 PTS sugar transporter subunit IIB [Anaerolineae bacterium]HPL28120.1 PTS sugar transporter subunit IIB [Anaerolineae bacterium]
MMKRVYLVCGTGIATSSMLRAKIEDFLDDHGIRVTITQHRVAELNAKRIDADLIVATTIIPPDIKEVVTVLDGIPLITGIGQDKFFQELLRLLQER